MRKNGVRITQQVKHDFTTSAPVDADSGSEDKNSADKIFSEDRIMKTALVLNRN
jgi:hypothetical protein